MRARPLYGLGARFRCKACHCQECCPPWNLNAPPDSRDAAPGWRKKRKSCMAKSLTEIRSLARSHTRTALNVLVSGMRSKDATAAAKVSAANAILDRGWGNGLQLRLMRALESRARHNGWSAVVSDTTENLASANNFIRAGYRLYQPHTPWAWPNTLYLRKSIR